MDWTRLRDSNLSALASAEALIHFRSPFGMASASLAITMVNLPRVPPTVRSFSMRPSNVHAVTLHAYEDGIGMLST